MDRSIRYRLFKMIRYRFRLHVDVITLKNRPKSFIKWQLGTDSTVILNGFLVKLLFLFVVFVCCYTP